LTVPAGYNESKHAVLSFLIEAGEATASEIANVLGISQPGASSYLLKLHQKGLLSRRRSRNGRRFSRERIYSVTQKGAARLEWLEASQGIFHPDWVTREFENGVFIPIWR